MKRNTLLGDIMKVTEKEKEFIIWVLVEMQRGVEEGDFGWTCKDGSTVDALNTAIEIVERYDENN